MSNEAAAKKGFNIKNTAGMFDLFKGVTMLTVIIVHTMGLFPILSLKGVGSIRESLRYSFSNPLFVIFQIFTTSLMPSMFIVSGYGFRKSGIKQCIKRQFKTLMIPYLITAIITAIVHLIDHYAFYHYLPGAIKETGKILGGSLLGLAKTTQYGDVMLFANGPNWFILALFWGLIVFDIVLTYVPENKLFLTVLLSALVGWILSFGNTFPLCISQGFVSVLYIYLGYYAKKKKLFTSGLTAKNWGLFVLFCIIPQLIMTCMGGYFGMADDAYGFGIISIVEQGLFSIFFLYLFLPLNRFRGKIAMFIRSIGRYSIYILCIHTIEMMGFPLYYFANNWTGNIFLGTAIFAIVRVAVVIIICYLFVTVKDFVVSRKKRNE